MIHIDPHCRYAILDCDGVILNTNKSKYYAFVDVANDYFPQFTCKYSVYLQRSIGRSRFAKLDYLIGIANPAISPSSRKQLLGEMVNSYSLRCREIMLTADINKPFLDFCANRFHSDNLGVVSNSEERELKEVFDQRALSDWFGLGLHGSPATKKSNLLKITQAMTSFEEVVYIGDTKDDRECCAGIGMPFRFYDPWSSSLS